MRASICATDKYGEHADFDDEWTDAEEEDDIRLTSMIIVMINGRNGLLKNDDDDDDGEQGTWTYHCMAPHNVKFPYLSMDDKSGEN